MKQKKNMERKVIVKELPKYTSIEIQMADNVTYYLRVTDETVVVNCNQGLGDREMLIKPYMSNEFELRTIKQ